MYLRNDNWLINFSEKSLLVTENFSLVTEQVTLEIINKNVNKFKVHKMYLKGTSEFLALVLFQK